MGQTQTGWYSFDWLERLFTFKIYNHYDIHPEWRDLKLWFKRFCWTWNWEVRSIASSSGVSERCRLRWRCDCDPPPCEPAAER